MSKRRTHHKPRTLAEKAAAQRVADKVREHRAEVQQRNHGDGVLNPGDDGVRDGDGCDPRASERTCARGQ